MHVHLVPTLDGVSAGDRVTVDGAEGHHAVAVRRLRVGEPVLLTDGRGRSTRGEVDSTGRGEFIAVIGEVVSTPRPAPELVVVQALPKGDRGERAVEVLTEIGVSQIVPWAASRSVAVWKGDRGAKALSRWRATAREAAKQARRTWFPEVTELASTADVVGLFSSSDVNVPLHEAAEGTFASLDVSEAATITLVVGPEGGLTDDELATFEAAGAHAVRLGPEVLRTSTAGLAAAAALLARTPRWR